MHSLGATCGKDSTHFCVWAPKRTAVDVIINDVVHPLKANAGYFEGDLHAPAGTRYRYRVDKKDAFPDPCSRFQPEGPHGPSEVIDASRFAWNDRKWPGIKLAGQVFYELHVGTFTPAGTWAGAEERLSHLRDVGITCVEIMPVHAFPGRFNWGYDGVNLFAPCAVYGRPDDFRHFVDTAHKLQLGVILDVVYNHFGPDGNYLKQFSDAYFTDQYPPEWGEPVRFEGSEALPVREMITTNAAQWINEYHLDGLRLDATQNLHDDVEKHIIADVVSAARAAAPARDVVIICENEAQNERLTRAPAEKGYGADSMWIDDFHHCARVAMTGNAEAYLQDYKGSAQELLACALSNAIYQGQWYAWQQQGRGTPVYDRTPESVTFYLQNHDQVANTLHGERMHRQSDARTARALTTLMLLLPQTPLLFQGQEFFASSPFLFFVDHEKELMSAVQKGRGEFLKQFPSYKAALENEGYQLHIGESAFRRSQLDWSETEKPLHAGALNLHRDLLRRRREDPALKGKLRGAVLSDRALVLRYFGGPDGDRLLLLNLGTELRWETLPEPLLAPRPGELWHPVLSSEDARYGGQGATFPSAKPGPWRIQGRSCCLLQSQKGPAS